MHALLHNIGVIAVLPYLGLALLDTLANQAEGFIRWGFYSAVLLWVGLVGLWIMGFVPQLQRPASLCLCVLALGSLAVIVVLQSTHLGPGKSCFSCLASPSPPAAHGCSSAQAVLADAPDLSPWERWKMWPQSPLLVQLQPTVDHRLQARISQQAGGRDGFSVKAGRLQWRCRQHA